MANMPRHPGLHYGEKETNAMEDACQAFAAELGIPCSKLREKLAEARRGGKGYMDAISEVEREEGPP